MAVVVGRSSWGAKRTAPSPTSREPLLERIETMDRPTFTQLLARADDETLQHLVGSHAVRLLTALDPRLATPALLRRTCIRLHSPEALLDDPESRSRLLALLRPEHATALAEELGVSPDAPYEALRTVPIRRASRRHQLLLAFFGLVSTSPQPITPLRSLEEHHPNYGLFDHQRTAQRAVVEALRLPDRRVLLHMPTGAGKTRTALHVVTSELRRSEPAIVIWLAYSEELCDQAASEFNRACSCLGDRTVDIYRFWGADRDLEIDTVRDGFLVAGLAKTYERAKRDGQFLARLADRTVLVVVDEAHQAIADTYRVLLEYLVNRNDQIALLGLTATPGRSWNDPSLDEKLSGFFCRHKVMLQVPGYRNPIDYLIDQGYLARPLFRSLRYKSNGGSR